MKYHLSNVYARETHLSQVINETIGYSRFIIMRTKIKIKVKLIEWKCITVKTYLRDKTVRDRFEINSKRQIEKCVSNKVILSNGIETNRL